MAPVEYRHLVGKARWISLMDGYHLDIELSGEHYDATGLLVHGECRDCGIHMVGIGRLVQCLNCGSSEVTNWEN
jgi:hypothetical protein